MLYEHNDFLKDLNKTLEKINSFTLPIKKFQQSMQPIFNIQKINPIFNVITSLTQFQQINKQLEKLPERTQRAIMILANEGWFIESETPIRLLLDTEYKSIEDIEELFILHYENNLDSIEKNLIERFPSRASILKEAFYAHKKEMYALSVPIFLIQSDGICFDLTECLLFYRKNELNKYIESNLTSIFLRPLKEKIPLIQNEKERDKGFNKMNRHMILHGECINYPTKINSLKAISLMAYLLKFLEKD